jgi:small subunit ribosomal protein S14
MSTAAKEYKAKKLKETSKYPTRVYNRCSRCGRSRGYLRHYGLCRICFRELATEGKIPGVKKSNW